jgi:uncharacterized membrane protein YdjX (TVP38/TMEM64 family)
LPQAFAVGIAVAVLAALGVVGWLVARHFDAEEIAEAIGTHGRAWYAVPVTLLAFVVLSTILVPVLGMTVVAGFVLGPWRGAACALAGAMCAAALGFWIGRRLGRDFVERLGVRVRGFSHRLGENGVLGTFLMRKVPAPFVIVNMVAGASRLRFRDFMLGTLLGMGVMVCLLAVFGHQLSEGMRGQRPTGLALGAAAVVLVLLVVANRVAKRRGREP